MFTYFSHFRAGGPPVYGDQRQGIMPISASAYRAPCLSHELSDVTSRSFFIHSFIHSFFSYTTSIYITHRILANRILLTTMLLLPTLILLCLLLVEPSHGSETDGYTFRKALLDPSFQRMNDILNHITNARIQHAIQNLHGCDTRELETVVEGSVGDMKVAGISLPVGIIEMELNDGQSEYYLANTTTNTTNTTLTTRTKEPLPLPVIRTPYPDNIYSGFRPLAEKGILTNGKLKAFAVFKLQDATGQDLVIGSDKTAHFFSQVKEYLDHYRTLLHLLAGTTLQPGFVKSYALDDTLNFGIETEIKAYGLGLQPAGIDGTGVFSWADLSTNFSGLLFWFLFTRDHSLLVPDGLWDQVHLPSQDRRPYFTCCVDTGGRKRWKMTRTFRWEDFVTPAWDETVNANEFLTESMKAKFMGRIQALHAKGLLPRDNFPLEPELCRRLMATAPFAYLQKFLNPTCLDWAREQEAA